MCRKILTEELIHIFRVKVLFYKNHMLDDMNSKYTKWFKTEDEIKSEYEARKRDNESIKIFRKYLEDKQEDIEFKLSVFESIPHSDIYDVMEKFVRLLAGWKERKVTITASDTKKSRNHINKRIAKEITIIEKYQDFIEKYTATEDNLWFKDEVPELCILNQELNTAYEINKKLLNELKTKKFNILLYGGGYSPQKISSKSILKNYFENLRSNYEVETMHIKQMIDIL